jgi:hypothetical protein
MSALLHCAEDTLLRAAAKTERKFHQKSSQLLRCEIESLDEQMRETNNAVKKGNLARTTASLPWGSLAPHRVTRRAQDA